MIRKIRKQIISYALAGIMALGFLNGTSIDASAAGDTASSQDDEIVSVDDNLNTASQVSCNYTLTGNTANYNCIATPYQMHGKLAVSGTNLVDASGTPVQLRGVSLHGIQHTNGSTTAFKDYANLSAFQILRDEWGVNLIRIPVYTEEGGYCQGNQTSMDTTIQKAVNYASQLGMYVIIDWHILGDGNPWNHQSEAKTFFQKYSKMYAGKGNVIYEICNEPNNTDWSTVKSYATSIIPVIRANDSNAIIVVGTPTWSQDVDTASYNPIRKSDIGGIGSQLAPNVLYSIHFYAAEYWHKDNLRNKVTTAHNNGLPMFCTEFGITQASGDGNIDIASANTWMSLLKSYNISYACWSFSNNNQTSSIFVSSCKKLNSWTNSDLSNTGCWFVNTTRPLYDAEMANYSPTVYNGVDYSAVYNYDYYINKYADLKKAFGTDKRAAIAHFVNNGMKEGRQAKADFNVYYYKNRYADLRKAFGTDLTKYYKHYITNGKKEGRDAKTYCAAPANDTTATNSNSSTTTNVSTGTTVLNGINYSAVYDFNYYINKYPDIKKAYGNDDKKALQHFVNFGMREGRQAKADFNVYYYRNRYVDLRKAFGTDLKKYYIHYINNGRKEGRDAKTACDLQGGITKLNGIDYSAVYDYNYYVNKYPDIKKAFGDNDEKVLNHFVTYGMKEGRQAKATFNVYTYKANYADLQKAFGNDLKKYYLHYINYGIKENRKSY